MTNVPSAVVQFYHRILVAYYRLAERTAEFFNLSRRLSLAMLVVSLLGAGLATLALINNLPVAVGLIVVLFVLLPYLAIRPEWTVIVVAFAVASLISTVFWDALALGEQGITLPNILVAYGLLVVAIRAAAGVNVNRQLWSTPSSIALLAFLAISIGFTFFYHILVTGLSYRKELSVIQHNIMWLLYFVFIGAATNERKLRLLQGGILAVAFIGSIPTILQAVIGEQALFFLKLTQKDIRLERTEGLLRVLPPGENLILVALLVATQMAVISSGGKRLGWLALTATYAMAILMTLTRHAWFSALFALAIFWWFSDTRTKVNTLIGGVLAATVVLLLAAITTPLTVYQSESFFAKIERRFLSTFQEDPLQFSHARVSSVGQRTYEMTYILRRLPETPWFGFGWSAELPVRLDTNPYMGMVFSKTTYIHNSFWWIVAKGGIVGAIGLLLLWVVVILRGYYLYKHAPDVQSRAWLLALWVGFMALIIAGQFEPVFWMRSRIIAVVVTLALMETVFYFSSRKTPAEPSASLS
ncbi:MAG: O-antigen ligase family protein [Armatimonadota bacterium]|nr:O-antigen ligase family protein [bacterium]MDW8321311.1 O-antigen ligase family protein [Armatimonadota bacterium]